MVTARPEAGTKAALRAAYDSHDWSTWRAPRWDPPAERHREFASIDSLKPGAAFWLIMDDGGQPLGWAEPPTGEGDQEIPLSAGLHEVEGEGERRYGTPVESGACLYRIRAEGFQETRKMVLVG